MYLDFYKMNASIYKVGESSIEKKTPPYCSSNLIIGQGRLFLSFVFRRKHAAFFFFYQKPSIGIYSTSEAYTIV